MSPILAAARFAFICLGVAMVIVAMVSPEMSAGFKAASIVGAVLVGVAIGVLGDGQETR